MRKQIIALSLFGILFSAQSSFAQLNKVFSRIFEKILITDFQATGTGVHQEHFLPADTLANMALVPALN
ncbi:MAG: hypothetical protein ACRENG_17615, partial [bacterium]